MAKEILRTTDTDRAVDRWLKEVPHSLDEVISYTISRGVDKLGKITIEMYFNEPVQSVVQEYLVGESGPELFPPGLLCKCMDSECTNPHYVPEDEEE